MSVCVSGCVAHVGPQTSPTLHECEIPKSSEVGTTWITGGLLPMHDSVAVFVPPPALCTDNGLMVAWAGLERLALGLTDDLVAPARARWPLDPAAEPAPGAGVKA